VRAAASRDDGEQRGCRATVLCSRRYRCSGSIIKRPWQRTVQVQARGTARRRCRRCVTASGRRGKSGRRAVEIVRQPKGSFQDSRDGPVVGVGRGWWRQERPRCGPSSPSGILGKSSERIGKSRAAIRHESTITAARPSSLRNPLPPQPQLHTHLAPQSWTRKLSKAPVEHVRC
jgi:hypothetical protein